MLTISCLPQGGSIQERCPPKFFIIRTMRNISPLTTFCSSALTLLQLRTLDARGLVLESIVVMYFSLDFGVGPLNIFRL